MKNGGNIKRIAAVVVAFGIMISGLPAPMVQAKQLTSDQSVAATDQKCVTDGNAIAERQDNGYYTISAADGFSQASLTEKMDIQKERLRMKVSLEASEWGNAMKVGYLGFCSSEPWNVSAMNFSFMKDNTTGNMMFKIWHNPNEDKLAICLMNRTETGVEWPAILNIWNFDWEAEHTFGLVKADGNWYLEIDDQDREITKGERDITHTDKDRQDKKSFDIWKVCIIIVVAVLTGLVVYIFQKRNKRKKLEK